MRRRDALSYVCSTTMPTDELREQFTGRRRLVDRVGSCRTDSLGGLLEGGHCGRGHMVQMEQICHTQT